MTYDPIASTTLASPASSVTFSSLDTIAAGYRDLIIVASPIDSTGFTNVRIQLNGDTGSNYHWVRMTGNGSTAASGSSVTGGGFGGDAYVLSSSERMVQITQIFDFSATDKHKSALTRGDSGNYITSARAERWANTAAVTSLTILGGTYAAGSTFSLYGIAG